MDDASLSGTVIEMWMSPQALEQCLPANESVSGNGCAAGSQFNSNLYYELVDPLAPLSLTGTFWYQGESVYHIIVIVLVIISIINSFIFDYKQQCR